MTCNVDWVSPQTIADAKKIQSELSQHVKIEDCFTQPIEIIAGMDVSNNRFDPLQMVYSAVVNLSYSDLSVLETASCGEKQKFPYISGLLSFREIPVIINAFKKLTKKPDLIIFDGQGICHPRGVGIASHFGVLFDIPTIGVAKSILVGTPQGELGEEQGSQVPLIWKDKIVGMMLRSKRKCSPLIISPGHMVSLETAVTIVKKCLKGYKLPECTRQAHLAANACRISFSSIDVKN